MAMVSDGHDQIMLIRDETIESIDSYNS